MAKKAYLTIDDSPTSQTDDLTGFLAARGVPAVLYCIGGDYEDLGVHCQGIESNPGPLVRAVEKGFVLGNHCYSHTRSSAMTYDAVVAEIEKTEALIDGLYRAAGRPRPVRLLRFPHLDRGTGGWIVDYDAAGKYRQTLMDLFTDGLNIKLAPPSPRQRELKERLQDYLAREGFTSDIFEGVTHPWYAETEMARARDALYTFSTSDWMLNPSFAAHAGKWPYKSVQALKDKIDADPWLRKDDSAHIILSHDHEGLLDVTKDLVGHFLEKGFAFAG